MTHFSNSGHTHSVCFRCAECFVGRVKPYTLRVQTFVQSFFARCVGRVRPYTHHVQPFVQTFDTRNDSLVVRRTGSPCTCVARHYSLLLLLLLMLLLQLLLLLMLLLLLLLLLLRYRYCYRYRYRCRYR